MRKRSNSRQSAKVASGRIRLILKPVIDHTDGKVCFVHSPDLSLSEMRHKRSMTAYGKLRRSDWPCRRGPLRAVPVAGYAEHLVQCCTASDGGYEPNLTDAASTMNVSFSEKG